MDTFLSETWTHSRHDRLLHFGAASVLKVRQTSANQLVQPNAVREDIDLRKNNKQDKK